MVVPAYGSGARPHVWQPANLDELQTVKQRCGDKFKFVAGGTLLRTQWEGGIASLPPHLISLEQITEASGIFVEEDQLVLGALNTLNECASNPLLQRFPLVQDAARAIAAPSIRNLATIGGNVVSGVGDAIPALLVYDAGFQWMTDAGVQVQSLSSWLAELKAGKHDPHRMLLAIQLPLSSGNGFDSAYQEQPSTLKQVSFFRKLGRRETFSASLVTVAYHGIIGADGRWIEVRIAAGGGSGMAMRLYETEALLSGKVADIQQSSALSHAAASEFVTYGDAFATDLYRSQATGNLLGGGLWEALNRSSPRLI